MAGMFVSELNDAAGRAIRRRQRQQRERERDREREREVEREVERERERERERGERERERVECVASTFSWSGPGCYCSNQHQTTRPGNAREPRCSLKWGSVPMRCPRQDCWVMRSSGSTTGTQTVPNPLACFTPTPDTNTGVAREQRVRGLCAPHTQTPRKQARQREGESERKREGEREPFVTCCRRVENAEGACESQSLASSRFRAAGLSCAGSY